MARARNIKPGLFKNEDLAECSVWARYIFPGLWMLADRDGRLEDRPKRIKGELLPFDSQDIEPLLQELASMKDAQGVPFIIRYQNSDGRFIQISKFSTHQTPHYSEKKSVIKPPDFLESPQDHRPSIPSGLPDNSGNTAALRGGRNPLNPDSLNPDSLNPDSLNPDSLIPDSLIPDARGSTVPPPTRTPGADACLRMKAAGLQGVNPSHPKLLALLQAGITPDELAEAAADAAGKGKPFAYALATAEGRRRDAAVQPLPDKPGPTVPGPSGPDPELVRRAAEDAAWKPPSPEVKAMLAQTVARLKGATT